MRVEAEIEVKGLLCTGGLLIVLMRSKREGYRKGGASRLDPKMLQQFVSNVRTQSRSPEWGRPMCPRKYRVFLKHWPSV